MDILTLDQNFSAQDVVDDYRALIWTDRYSAHGDIVLEMKDSATNRARFPENTFLSIPVSSDVMMIETRSVENGILKLEGPSLLGFLKHRIARDTWSNVSKAWEITGNPGAIITEVVRQMIARGGWIADGSVVAASNGQYEIMENVIVVPASIGASQTTQIPFGSVYDAIQPLAEENELGLVFRPQNVTESDHELLFTVYQGRDLTSAQSTFPTVRFEPALDSLTDVKELRSIANYKNFAYAWAPNVVTQNFIMGTASIGPANTRGFQRRTLMVLADDINPGDPGTTSGQAALTNILNRRARNALANHVYVKLLEGQILQQGPFKYGTDYALGDVVELRDPVGGSDKARITEYTHVHDDAGYRSYPTLTLA